MFYDLADRRGLSAKLYEKNCKRPIVRNHEYALTIEGIIITVALVVAGIKWFR